MARNVYECMFILDSNRYARDPGSVSEQIPQIIEKFGGEVLASRLWNEQRLAYPIEGNRKGTYWLSYFQMDAEKTVDFNRACRLNENILRNMTLKVEPRLVDTLVAHARGEVPEEPTEEPAARKTAEKPASEKPASEKPASEKPASEKPASASETPSGEAPSKQAEELQSEA